MNRVKKELIVKKISDCLSLTKVIIFTDFTGLNVEQMSNLYEQLQKDGFKYMVVKNTLMELACKNIFEGEIINKLVGPNGLGLSYDDPIGLSKILINFAKNNPNLKIKGGIYSGKIIDVEQINILAKISSHSQLFINLLNILNGMPRNLINILGGVLYLLINVLKAIKEKKNI